MRDGHIHCIRKSLTGRCRQHEADGERLTEHCSGCARSSQRLCDLKAGLLLQRIIKYDILSIKVVDRRCCVSNRLCCCSDIGCQTRSVLRILCYRDCYVIDHRIDGHIRLIHCCSLCDPIGMNPRSCIGDGIKLNTTGRIGSGQIVCEFIRNSTSGCFMQRKCKLTVQCITGRDLRSIYCLNALQNHLTGSILVNIFQMYICRLSLGYSNPVL